MTERRTCEHCGDTMPDYAYGVHLFLAHPGVEDVPLEPWVMRADIDTDVSYFDQLPPWRSYVGKPVTP